MKELLEKQSGALDDDDEVIRKKMCRFRLGGHHRALKISKASHTKKLIRCDDA